MKKRSQVVQLFLLLFLITFGAQSQSLAINSTCISLNTSFILDLTSIHKRVIIPGVNLASLIDAAKIPTPAHILLVYCTNAVITNELHNGNYFIHDSGNTTQTVSFIKM